jgi:putative ABC transport system permease protein
MDQKFSIVRPIQLDRARTQLVQFCCQGIARLKPGVTVDRANADVSRMLPLDPFKFPINPGLSPTLWNDARIAPMLRPLKDALVGNLADTLWVLMGTVGIVLLIACANVANLMLVRADTRRQELAIRASLGADRSRIARELVLESALLGGAGGVLGLACAFGAVRLFSTSEFERLPRIHEIAVDGPVLIFSLAASLMAGVVFGLIPVLRYGRPVLLGALHGGNRSQTQSRETHRARNVLVVVQMALALVLLVGSGLMIRSFQQLRRVAPGFSGPAEIETFRVVIPSAQVKEFRGVIDMQEAMLRKVQAIPGVRSAALINELPMDGGNNDPVFTEDKPESKTSPIRRFKFISPGYFSTVGSRIVAGRDMTWPELDRAAPFALISDNLAREWWGSAQAAIGKRIRPYLQGDWREVIGVVTDLHDDGIEHPAPTVVYWPLFRRNFYKTPDYDAPRSVAFLVRTSRAGSASLVQELQSVVASVNGSVAVANVGSLESLYDKSLERTSFTVIMLAIAGGMALLLGLIGIYAVISYSVSQRTREMGIRLALGSPAGKVRWLFVRHAVLLCAAGALIGLASAFALTRLTKTLLYDISPADPPTYVVVVVGLMAAAMTASYIPARKASRVDPAETLRSE